MPEGLAAATARPFKQPSNPSLVGSFTSGHPSVVYICRQQGQHLDGLVRNSMDDGFPKEWPAHMDALVQLLCQLGCCGTPCLALLQAMSCFVPAN